MGSAKHGDITQGYGAIGTPLCWTHGTHKGSNNGTSLHKSGWVPQSAAACINPRTTLSAAAVQGRRWHCALDIRPQWQRGRVQDKRSKERNWCALESTRPPSLQHQVPPRTRGEHPPRIVNPRVHPQFDRLPWATHCHDWLAMVKWINWDDL